MNFRANGKLLITGEYLVLKGAKSLAMPTKLGQTMEIKTSNGSEVNWKAYDSEGEEWFHATLDLFDLKIEKTNDEVHAEFLRKLIKMASRQNSDFLSQWKKYKIKTKLEFPLDWGFGSSSTIVYLVSQWAELNPFELYFELFEGSGYDLACAYADGPISYQLTEESVEIEDVDFSPKFKNKLYFVYLGSKQSSSASLAEHKTTLAKLPQTKIEEMSDMTDQFLKAKSLSAFQQLMTSHEEMVSGILKVSPIQKDRFPSFPGAIKSLGAWGGDFIMAASDASEEAVRLYFQDKGLDTVLTFDEIMLQ